MLKALRHLAGRVLDHMPLVRHVRRTRGRSGAITVKQFFIQKVLGVNRSAYWPVHFTSTATAVHKIRVGVGTAPGVMPGCYIQGGNGIEIGDYTRVARGVGIISANHSVYDYLRHEQCGPIRIGNYCWIGMNSIILPGVRLGNHTVVGAGAVVTKSFPEGYCVLGGVPAQVLKHVEKEKIVDHRDEHEYIGFYPLAGRTKEEIYEHLGIERV